MELILGPGSRAFRCLDCGQVFGWHPDTSGLSEPSGCGACDSPNLEEIIPEKPGDGVASS